MPRPTMGRGGLRGRGRRGSGRRGHGRGRVGKLLNDGRPESAIDDVQEAEELSEEGTWCLG